MSTLYIAELSAGGSPAGEPVAMEPLLVQSPVTISGVSAQSAAFGGDTKMIRVFSDTTCAIVFGTNPTATVSSGVPLGSEQPEYFAVKSGDKLAVITR